MNQRIKLLINLWLPVVGWCCLIFYLSSVPNLKTNASPYWDEIIRSVAHFFVYTILYILFFRAISYQRKKDFILPLALGLLYGLTDETHQLFVPSRTFQFKDLAVDFSGVVFGFIILNRLLPFLPSKIRRWIEKTAFV